MRDLGKRLVGKFKPGDVVFLEGGLGAGKTTLVRGMLEGLGVTDPVRSPTFNLIQVFDTKPPVMHADLYRLKSHQGIGIEDYLDTHICLIEWADRAVGMVEPEDTWHIIIEFDEPGRVVAVTSPVTSSP